MAIVPRTGDAMTITKLAGERVHCGHKVPVADVAI